MSGRLQKPAGRVCRGKQCFCGGRAVPRLSWTSLGSIRAGAMGCSAAWRHLLPKEATTVGRDSQPSWCFHVSPHPKTHPHPSAVPRLGCTSHCHSGSFWQDIQPPSFHPSCPCLSLPAAPQDGSHRPNPPCPQPGTTQTRLGSPAPALFSLFPSRVIPESG